ncbi:MAG TPA: ATP-binding cassette domain-containing protein [Vicinamibacterales bacterium]|nr:ATP-binding cassette domain-containing protein [Vicinamibacterales bacterium]
MPVLTLDSVSHAFGHLPLLDDVQLVVEAGERVALIGRNGTGKSTLLQILSGELEPDAGTIWREPRLRAARLVQDAALSTPESVFDVVAGGLGDLRDVVTAYHHAAVDVAERGTADALDVLGRWQHELEERDGWRVEQRVELVLSRLNLPANAPVDTLSGGWRRRVLLARALVAEPTLLLLDEPTNHLDVEAIEWLESFLMEYTGALVFVTHDRAFLDRLATRVIELDRGHLTSWPGDYPTFVAKKEAWLADEALAAEKFDKRLAQEEAWLRRGVKARRTRDEGRVRALMAMREVRAARRTQDGTARLQIDVADRSGQVVFDADRVTKAYEGTIVVRDFSTRILRGDRVGLIGPNGAGKTTLLRLLVGEVAPDSGEISHGTNVQIAYFDQQREQLDPERTVVDTVADGNDMVTVGGSSRHVYGYLEDFLFPPERARSPVKALSGGERARLLLARLFTRPANVLILDEPTNDLDIETLELLEAQLVDFSGTLLIVSHDRRFLNNVVTSTLAFEGDGRVEEYVGGYDDWLRQRSATVASAPPPEAARVDPEAVTSSRTPRPQKLSYKERREFDELPARIEALETEQADLEARMALAEFYLQPASAITEAVERLEAIRAELDAVYRRWDELDSRGG